MTPAQREVFLIIDGWWRRFGFGPVLVGLRAWLQQCSEKRASDEALLNATFDLVYLLQDKRGGDCSASELERTTFSQSLLS